MTFTALPPTLTFFSVVLSVSSISVSTTMVLGRSITYPCSHIIVVVGICAGMSPKAVRYAPNAPFAVPVADSSFIPTDGAKSRQWAVDSGETVSKVNAWMLMNPCSLLIDASLSMLGDSCFSVFRSLIGTIRSGSPVDTIIGLMFGFCGIFIVSADAPRISAISGCVRGEGLNSGCAISIIMFFSCFLVSVYRATGKTPAFVSCVTIFCGVSSFM